jgi:inositol-phosphate transport system substrate-binding protein
MRHVKTAMAALLLAALGGGSAAIFVSAPAPAQTTVKLELWSRQDPSGPLRPANVVKAADRLNKELAAEGSGKRVKVAVHESPAPGFDDDALQLLKVFGIGQGPDLFIAAHEWICAFQQEGFALKLDDYIAKYPQYFATIFPSLWQSVKCSDGIYGIPQDAEARMFFYNKKLLREAGYDDAFIEAMPARTLSGELTMDDVIDIANRVINKAKAQYGILHRPNKGPDYIMAFQSYGNNFLDLGTGTQRSAIRRGLAAGPRHRVAEDHQIFAQQPAIRRSQRDYLHGPSGRRDGPAVGAASGRFRRRRGDLVAQGCNRQIANVRSD